ncbi:MAG TPA: cellulase family glycosylhydrolase, partial [Bacteroidota bacterium]
RKFFVQRADIDSLARWGFNSVRLPMHYALLSPAPGTYSEAGFVLIDSLLAWCEANHLYLILDLHAAPGGQNLGNISDYQGPPCLWESAAYQQWTAEIWKTIAGRYASREWIGGYDLLNETNYSFAAGNKPLRDLLMRITDSIRTVDRNHLIFAEGNSYATDFSGLTPAWDANMAWSFHKYWNTNDLNSIQSYMNLRGASNTPLWMGESGENSNQWFADAIALLTRYNIGWSWWTLKKLETISAPFSVTKSPKYDALLKYWSGSGGQPTVADAVAALSEQAGLLDLAKCTFHPDFIDALMRLPFTDERKPYADNVAPGNVFAVNYDMGKNWYSYYDTDFQNTGGGGYNLGWAYRNDGVDIQPSTDPLGNGFNVGWTAAGEFLAYTLRVQTGGTYNIKIRCSSANAGTVAGTVRLSLDNAFLTPQISLPTTGGWQTWRSVDCGNYALAAGIHDLVVTCVSGGYNLSRLEFTQISSGVAEDRQAPRDFALGQNYPNPFNPTTVIGCQWPVASRVTLMVYDLLGREVARLIDGVRPAGTYAVTFDGTDLPSGLYFYRLTASPAGGGRTIIRTRAMALTR